MSHRRMAALGCLFVVLAWTGEREALRSVAGADSGPAPRAAPADFPCHAAATRAVTTEVIEEDGDLGVQVDLAFSCPTGSRKVNLFFLQNGLPVTSPEPHLTEINTRFRAGMRAFVEQIDASSGSRGAYSVFDSGFTPNIPLTDFAAWPSVWGAWLTPQAATSGVLAAMRDAAAMLQADAAGQGAESFIVVTFASAQPIGTAADQLAACDAVRAAGARLVVIDLQGVRGSGGLGDLTCTDSYLRSVTQDGSDLDQVFSQLTDVVLTNPHVVGVEVFEGLSDPFGYIRRSGSPRDPDTAFGSDLTWSFTPPESGELTLEYRVRGGIGWSDIRAPLSRAATVTFVYADGSETRIDLPNPSMCIHTRGRPQFCAPKPTGTKVFLPALDRNAAR